MDYDVLKPFNTVNRRLVPGAGARGTFGEMDDPAPFTRERLIEKGFIRAKKAPPAPVVAADQPKPDAAPKPKKTGDDQ